jgi:hypothetical protein
MPLVRACSAPGCSTLTMGEFCVEHEQLANTRFAKRSAALFRRFRAPALALAIAAAAAIAGRASRSA